MWYDPRRADSSVVLSLGGIGEALERHFLGMSLRDTPAGRWFHVRSAVTLGITSNPLVREACASPRFLTLRLWGTFNAGKTKLLAGHTSIRDVELVE